MPAQKQKKPTAVLTVSGEKIAVEYDINPGPNPGDLVLVRLRPTDKSRETQHRDALIEASERTLLSELRKNGKFKSATEGMKQVAVGVWGPSSHTAKPRRQP